MGFFLSTEGFKVGMSLYFFGGLPSYRNAKMSNANVSKNHCWLGRMKRRATIWFLTSFGIVLNIICKVNELYLIDINRTVCNMLNATHFIVLMPLDIN